MLKLVDVQVFQKSSKYVVQKYIGNNIYGHTDIYVKGIFIYIYLYLNNICQGCFYIDSHRNVRLNLCLFNANQNFKLIRNFAIQFLELINRPDIS